MVDAIAPPARLRWSFRSAAGIGSGRGRLVVPAVAMVLFSIGLISGLVWLSGEGQNQAVRQREVHVVRSVLQSEQERLGDLAKDYSWWDLSYNNLFVNFSEAWADKNIGSYLRDNFKIDISAAVSTAGQVVYGMDNGVRSDADPAVVFGPAFQILVAAARQSPFRPVVPATGILFRNGTPYLVAVSRFTSEDVDRAAAEGTEREVLVLGRALDQALLDHFSSRFLLKNLHWSAGADGAVAVVPLTLPDDRPAGVLSWQPPRPGDRLMWSLLPGLMAGMAVITFLGLAIVNIWRTELIRSQMLDQRLMAVLRGAGDAILGYDGTGTVVSANRAAEHLFARPADDLNGLPISSLLAAEPAADSAQSPGGADAAAHGDPVGPLVVAGGDERLDGLAAIRPDGTTVPVEISISSAGSGGGRLHTAIIRDIVQRREIERRLIEAKNAAEAANQAKSDFIANVSHELRTPLVAIIGFSELAQNDLEKELADPRLVSYVGEIHAAGAHLLGLVNDLIELATMESRRAAMREEMIQLRPVAGDSLRLVAERAKSSGIILINACDPHQPNVLADRRMVKKMLNCLLLNAIKFSPDGGTITVTTALQDNGDLALSIADTGIGIAPESVEMVLRPFQQADGRLQRRFTGAGLGLPITKGLIELHQGRLELASMPGRGTTATLVFPHRRTARTAATPADQASPQAP